MRKILFITLLSFVTLTSCFKKPIALKGNYPETPMTLSSSKDFEEVWSNLIDLFAQKGLQIKIIDKQSGLIVSEESAFPSTTEDSKGQPLNKEAFIVVPKYYDVASATYKAPNENYFGRSQIYGGWNVRVKKSESGCIINVNLVNLYYMQRSRYGETRVNLATYKSTGVFETAISNLIK